MKITLVAAVGHGGVIGIDNNLPWHLPEDFAFFKRYTLQKPIVMGRKTWDSLPKKPLPERQNIVISRQKNYPALGATVVSSWEEALEQCKDEKEVCVIGGAEIYQIALPFATDLRLTAVDLDIPEGNQFFPEINWEEWCPMRLEPHVSQNGIAYRFLHYVRRPSIDLKVYPS